MCPKHYSEHFPHEPAQDNDLEHFLEDGVKVKSFLRLSHLYKNSNATLNDMEKVFDLIVH
jgi:hypothetical protein